MAAIADVLIPLALDTAYSYAVPDGLVLERGRRGPGAARAARDARRGLGRARRRGRQPQAGHGADRRAAAVAGAAPARRLGRLVHARPQGFGAGDGAEAPARGAGRGRPASACASPAAAEAPDAGPRRACSRRCRRAAGPAEARARAGGPGQRSASIDGLVDEGALEAVALAPEPVAEPPDPDHARPELSDGAARRRGGARRPGRGGGGLRSRCSTA